MKKYFIGIIENLVLILLIAGCNRTPVIIQTDAGPQQKPASPTAQISQITSTPTMVIPTITPEIQGEIVGDKPSGIIAFYSDRDGNPEIYTMFSDGSHQTRLTNDPGFDDSPAISPVGSKIVFLSSRNDPEPSFPDLAYEIYIMNIDGSNLIRLTTTESAEDHPSWSPDSKRILFDADYNEDGFFEIYTLLVDGSGLQQLTYGKSNDQFADWSPDGKQIAFSSYRNGDWDLYLIDLTIDAEGLISPSGDLTQLTDSDFWELFPAWSSDGKQIAYNSLQPGSGNTDVYLMEKDGSNIRKLTESPRFDENPTWSLDGTKIYFQTERDHNFEIYSMNIDGSQQEALSKNQKDDLWPSWGIRKMPEILPEFSLLKSEQIFNEPGTFQVALGDLDNDGDLDAIFANPMTHSSEVWFNAGDGTFIDSGQELTKYGHGVVLTDIDLDNDLDAIITCHQFITPSKVYLNDGLGSFQESPKNFDDALKSGTEINLIDIDSDDLDDVHISYYDPEGLPDKVFINDGQGGFTDSNLSLEESYIAWGDLDSDGDDDYFGKINHEGYIVKLNDGGGNFDTVWQLDDPKATVGSVVLADFDLDGDLDALIGNGQRKGTASNSLLFLNNGNAIFEDSGQLLNQTAGAEFAVGDLDNDGDQDIFVANIDRTNEVWINDGQGNLYDSTWRLESPMSGKATMGDLDNDGDLDIIVGSFSGMPIIWFNNN